MPRPKPSAGARSRPTKPAVSSSDLVSVAAYSSGSRPYPWSDMQYVTLFTQIYFQTKILTPEKPVNLLTFCAFYTHFTDAIDLKTLP